MTTPRQDTYPWEQLSMLQPELFSLRIEAHMRGDLDRISVNVQLREGYELILAGAQTFGGDLSTQSVDEIAAEIARWLHGAASRLVPFR